MQADPPVHIAGDPELTPARTHELIAQTLIVHHIDPDATQLGIHWVGAQEISSLNEQFRSTAKPTDVLSFPVDGLGDVPDGVPRMLGDIFICADHVREQLRDGSQMATGDTTLGGALARCLVHGLLHLLGYTHDPDESTMFAMEESILSGDIQAARQLIGESSS